MAQVITAPTVDVPVVTLARICRMKKNRNGVFMRQELDALVWDPTAVRVLLDERIYRNPTLALVMPGAGKDSR
jgi:hypothetical protein